MPVTVNLSTLIVIGLFVFAGLVALNYFVRRPHIDTAANAMAGSGSVIWFGIVMILIGFALGNIGWIADKVNSMLQGMSVQPTTSSAPSGTLDASPVIQPTKDMVEWQQAARKVVLKPAPAGHKWVWCPLNGTAQYIGGTEISVPPTVALVEVWFVRDSDTKAGKVLQIETPKPAAPTTSRT